MLRKRLISGFAAFSILFSSFSTVNVFGEEPFYTEKGIEDTASVTDAVPVVSAQSSEDVSAESSKDDSADSSLYALKTEDVEGATLSLYSSSDSSQVVVNETQVTAEEGLEVLGSYTFGEQGTAAQESIYVTAEPDDAYRLEDSESVSLYTVEDDAVGEVIVEDIAQESEPYELAEDVSGIAVVKDTGLRHLTLEATPGDATYITLDGMMPKDASVSAVDVTDDEEYISSEIGATSDAEIGTTTDADFGTLTDAELGTSTDVEPGIVTDAEYSDSEAGGTLLAAFDISILSADGEYQPGEDSPIAVEITDPRIEDGEISVWHIRDDGIREKVSDIQVSLGKVSFNATSFSVYEVVAAPASPINLDGKTYALAIHQSNVADNGNNPAALISENHETLSGRVKALDLIIRKNPLTNENLFITSTKNTELSLWTFEAIPGTDLYYVYSEKDGLKKYLSITDGNPEMLFIPDESCKLTVLSQNGKIKIGDQSDHFLILDDGNVKNGFSTNTSDDEKEWFSLIKPSNIGDDDFTVFSADKISVSDLQDGDKVVIYVRLWDESDPANKKYRFFVVSKGGLLVPAYEVGDRISWLGAMVNSTLWDFTVYDNNYYEFQNEYTHRFLAPQITNNQIVSNDKIGVNLPGRLNGNYSSTITAWDDTYYTYASLKIVDDTMVSVPMSEAGEFYFAKLLDDADQLTEVETVDNNEHGITMKMVDFKGEVYGNNRDRDRSQTDVIGNDAYTNGNVNSNLVSKYIADGEGYPVATKTKKSLSELFGSAKEVNHLFLSKTYNESGYFEYNCTNNFAHLNDDGNFTVYDQVASFDGNGCGTGKFHTHGQFMPYNSISGDKKSKKNPSNLTDEAGNNLALDDPRRGKPLYAIQFDKNNTNGGTNNEYANYFFGMELETAFTQTPNGCDAWGHDMIFEFTGDDDFWLYVDDVLVLDIGGIHDALSGSVNFKTGDVYVKKNKTNLRQIFYDNLPENIRDEFISANFKDGLNTFKDYSNHTMKIFYMERGAGASNLHMRFNLSEVKEGQVLLSKKIRAEGMDKDAKLDFNYKLVDFPFQIEYRSKDDPQGVYQTLKNTRTVVEDGVENTIRQVTYKNKPGVPVRYVKEGYTVGGKSYDDVFLLYADDIVNINFPENTFDYRIRECGVNTGENGVYSKVVFNEAELNKEQETQSGSGRYDYVTDTSEVKNRPVANFENYIDPENFRKLRFTKDVVDKNGNPVNNDTGVFDYRLYLGSENDNRLERDKHAANTVPYYVLDENGNYCEWEVVIPEGEPEKAEGRFVSLGTKEMPKNNNDAVFHTSPNGKISKIPAGYTVEVPNLPVGTKFWVEEREDEVPLGYTLQKYVMEHGSYTPDADEINRGTIVSTTIENDGTAKLYITNQKGYGFEANKIWSDDDYVEAHGDIYLALYVKKSDGSNDFELVTGTVKKLSHPNTKVKWFMEELADGKTLADYEVREVTLTNPGTDDEGNITYESISEVENNSIISHIIPNEGDDTDKEYKYRVVYNEDDPETNVRIADVRNIRSGGIEICLGKWNGNGGSRTIVEPIENGKFTLKYRDAEGAETTVESYTSDKFGIVTVLYDFEERTGSDDSGYYILTEDSAPTGYTGMSGELQFYVDAERKVHLKRNWNTDNSDDGWANHQNIGGDNEDVLARINVYNKQLDFSVIKYDDSEQPLSGAEFSLYKQIEDLKGNKRKDYDPLSGFESLITGADGKIPKIDGTLSAGTYYLTENNAPQGFIRLSGDIIFTVTESGEITLDNKIKGASLVSESASGSSVDPSVNKYILKIANQPSPQDNLLVIKKVVSGNMGSKKKQFNFTVKFTKPDDSDVTEYTWYKNSKIQNNKLKSGGEFKLSHGDSVVIYVPPGTGVTITETAVLDYSTTYKLGDGDAVEGNVANVTVDNNTMVTFTNERNALVPTGIWQGVTGLMILGILCLLGVIYFSRKRSR